MDINGESSGFWSTELYGILTTMQSCVLDPDNP